MPRKAVIRYARFDSAMLYYVVLCSFLFHKVGLRRVWFFLVDFFGDGIGWAGFGLVTPGRFTLSNVDRCLILVDCA